MSQVAKVYRVEVRYPGYIRQRPIVVKYGGKQMVTQTWRYYLAKWRACKASGKDASDGHFKVGVANTAVFQDISALYVTGGETDV